MAGTTTSNRSAALLDHLARLSRQRGEAALTPLGLRPRHLIVLTLLRDHEGSSQQALATTLSIDPTNLVGVLNELEAEQLIARRRSPEDRRRHIVELTPHGAKTLAKAEKALAAAEDQTLAALDPEERETLYRLLARATAGNIVSCGEVLEEEPPDC